ncbi:hypothetical protein V2J09_009435, partial [Rumex salicifolius]
ALFSICLFNSLYNIYYHLLRSKKEPPKPNYLILSRQIDAPSAFGDLPRESAPLEIPGFINPIPLNVWPDIFLNKENSAQFLSHASSDDRIPPVYTVGPVLDLRRQIAKDLDDRDINGGDHPIINWLDAQPPASVVFPSFGSIGSFRKEQVNKKLGFNLHVEQIASRNERSGHRLWFGVPVVMWPMYPEQQLNAFCMRWS